MSPSEVSKGPRFKAMYRSAVISDCQTRFMNVLKDLSGTYFVNVAVHNH